MCTLNLTRMFLFSPKPNQSKYWVKKTYEEIGHERGWDKQTVFHEISKKNFLITQLMLTYEIHVIFLKQYLIICFFIYLDLYNTTNVSFTIFLRVMFSNVRCICTLKSHVIQLRPVCRVTCQLIHEVMSQALVHVSQTFPHLINSMT